MNGAEWPPRQQLVGKPSPQLRFCPLVETGDRKAVEHITRMIAAHEFVFVTRSSTNFSPAVANAVSAAYPRVKEIAQHTLHLAPG